jgi:tetratricopeptide (TPR) repeat protein
VRRFKAKRRIAEGSVTPSRASQSKISNPLRLVIAIGLLGLLLAGAYWNSTRNGFVWDDKQQIVMNPELRATASWKSLFSSDAAAYQEHRGQTWRSNYYRPLQLAFYRITGELVGLDSLDLHILSMVFAFAASLAAFLVYLKLTGRFVLASVAAALFTVHPAHSEAVDWISALPEIGCTLFVLISFGLFLQVRAEGSGPGDSSHFKRAFLWCTSLLTFAVALLWKETAAALPVLMATYVFCTNSANAKQRLRSAVTLSLPFWCVLASYLVLRFRVLGFIATHQRNWALTPAQVALNDLNLMAQYWWKLIAPVNLNAYYMFNPIRSVFEPPAVLGILFAVVACVAVWYGFRRAPLAVFAGLWVFVSLLPAMNIYLLGRNVFTERYLFLPSFGFCLLAALLASALLKRLPSGIQKPVSTVLVIGILAGCCVRTIARNADWRDDATLFRRTLPLSPQAPFVHIMVASTEADNPGGVDADAADSAESHYRTAIDLAEHEDPPDFLDVSRAYAGLSSLYTDHEQYTQALAKIHDWRSIVPADPETDTEEGYVLLKMGSWQKAEELLNRAFATRPEDENVLSALGLLAWQYQHNSDAAVQLFSRAIAAHNLNDNFQASLHNNLGAVYGEREQFSSAIEQFRSAVLISPRDAEYHTNLATALAASGQRSEAVAETTVALQINSHYAPAQQLLQQLASSR